MTLMSWFRGIAPLWRQRTCPFLNNIRVGTACTPYSTTGSPCLSISTLIMRMRSPNCALSCSRTGCMALHGPHQVAKKSTNTSWPERITVLNVSIAYISNSNLSHMIAHPFQLNSSTEEIELMQTGNVSIESFFCSWLYVLVT